MLEDYTGSSGFREFIAESFLEIHITACVALRNLIWWGTLQQWLFVIASSFWRVKTEGIQPCHLAGLVGWLFTNQEASGCGSCHAFSDRDKKVER